MPSEIESEDTSTDSRTQQHGVSPLSSEWEHTLASPSYRLFRCKLESIFRHKNENGDTSSSNSLPRSSRIAAELLSPDQEFVNAILQHAVLIREPELGKLVSNYFSNGEYISRFCIRLLSGIDKARSNCNKMTRILEFAPLAGDFTEKQCEWLWAEFLVFIEMENPFEQEDLQMFETIHNSFQLSLKQIEQHLHKTNSKLRCINRSKKAAASCLIGAIIVIVICTILIATHSVVAIIAGPVLVCFPLGFLKKLQFDSISAMKRHCSQLDAAMRGTYILSKDLDTLSRLVTRLHNDAEDRRVLIQFCLQRNGDRHPVQEVVKELRKNDTGFAKKIDDIENHVCLCLMTINRVRKLLIEEIQIISRSRNGSYS